MNPVRLLPLLLLAFPLTGLSQGLGGDVDSEPLAGVDLTETIAPAADPAVLPAPLAPEASGPGQATRALFRLQASGERGGPGIPLMGVTANAAYLRYIKSFGHAIPEFFDTNVQSSSGK